jgi:hypothetical protein
VGDTERQNLYERSAYFAGTERLYLKGKLLIFQDELCYMLRNILRKCQGCFKGGGSS